MVPSNSVSQSGSLSDSTELSINLKTISYSKSEYYIHKKEKLIPTSTSKTNLYIRGLNENTTDNDLQDMCQKYGEIKSTKAIIDKQTLKCKGYGFVDFKSPEDAKSALADLKKEQKDVQLAKQREQDPTNLYFANLPSDIDEQCLSNMLKQKFNANVSSTRIMRERTGCSKGVGFARIDDNKLCDNIIQELNNKPFPEHLNKTKIILVKLADSGGILKSPKFKIHNNSDLNITMNTMNHSNNNINNNNNNNSNFSQNVLINNDKDNSISNASSLNTSNSSNNSNCTTDLNNNSVQNYQKTQYQNIAYVDPYHPYQYGYPIIYDNYQSGASIVSHSHPNTNLMYQNYFNQIHRQQHSFLSPNTSVIAHPQSLSLQTPHFYPYYNYPYHYQQQQQHQTQRADNLQQQFSNMSLNSKSQNQSDLANQN